MYFCKIPEYSSILSLNIIFMTKDRVRGIPDPKRDPSSSAAIAERIKYLIKRTTGTQIAFANKLGIDTSHISKQINGKSTLTGNLINRIVDVFGVSRDWLWLGMGTPFEAEPEQNRLPDGVPVYDIDVTAGNYDLDRMFTQDRIIGYVNLPRINRNNLIVHVSGDSMEPEIPNGTYIAIRPEEDFQSILYGQIYVVVTDDFRRVKYLRRCQADPSKVILHSANPNYDDIEIDKSQIIKLFRVDAILNFKICG